MRGAERPARVAWTHPFLPPLQPLSDDAARQMFIDITDGYAGNVDMNQLLQFTDNMPLAVDLIAHLVDYEGHTNVLTRWETEKTSLLSAGNDRRSNLDASIRVSLSSPRLTSGAKDLLSLLSILPDGLSDVELIQSNLPIQAIRSCMATLIATSLAYIDNKKRLRSLKYDGAQLSSIVGQITLNLANLHQVLYRGLQVNNPDVAHSVHCIINLNSFHRITGRRATRLMEHLPAVLSQLGDHRLEVQFTTDILLSDGANPIFNPALLIAQSISHCNHFEDPVVEAGFYQAAAYYLFHSNNNTYRAVRLLERGLTQSRSCGDIGSQCRILITMANIKRRIGDAGTGQIHANEARRLANWSGNLYHEAVSLRILAQCTCQLGDCRNSIAHLRRAKEILGICGLAGGQTESLIKSDEAEVHFLKSEYIDARSIHAQIQENTSQNPIGRAFALVNIAEIDILIGATEDTVQQKLNEATTIFSTMKYSYGITCCKLILADVKLREGDTQSAMTLFRQCLNSTWGRDIELVSHILERLADRTQWQALQCTFTWPVVHLGHAQQSKQKLAVHKALLFIGDVFVAEGDDHTAKSLFTVAQEGFVYMDVHCSRAQCLLRLGNLAEKEGNSSKALELWKAARPLFERASQAKAIAQIDARLAELEHDQKVPVHLATLPETIITKASGGVDPAEIGNCKGAGQKSSEAIMVSSM
ncbi:hypothetical protein B0H13DRAFT_1852980 [Mycena leptocephala]|nr:hypothetical protein B0H13DRAFT_1852980 [Mycena leptocephala]